MVSVQRFSALVFAALLGGILVPPARAQLNEAVPKPLDGVGVEQRVGETIPLDLQFTRSTGGTVTLGELFDGRRPMVLTLNYSSCPMLCSLQLNGLFDALGEIDLNLGSDYQMLTVSIDPAESPERAQLTRQKYLQLYRRPGSAEAYHCLIGEEATIRRLADAVGFGYRRDPVTGEYLHAAVTMILTPDGRVSHYLYGVKYEPRSVRMALIEASEGRLGTAFDMILQFCFQYDAERGSYAPAVLRLMRAGGVLTVLVLGAVLFGFWRRDRRRAAAAPQG